MAQTNANLIWKIADLLRGIPAPSTRRCGIAVPHSNRVITREEIVVLRDDLVESQLGITCVAGILHRL